MSFDDDETGVSTSRPIDLYTITTNGAQYWITSHIVDVQFGSRTFTATVMSRGNQTMEQEPTNNELILYLPITHPLVQRFAASGIPEQTVAVIAQRLQSTSGVAQQFYSGFGQSISIDGHVAMLRVPSVINDALKIQLPVVTAQRTCNHRLFDIGCAPIPFFDGPSQTRFTVSTTVVSVDASGLVFTLADVGGNPDQWAQYGRLIMADGESRNVVTQVGTTVTVDLPFGAVAGSAQLEAGCAHDIDTCITKFNNRINFGGAASMNPINLWVPNGFGVIQQV